MRKTKVLKLRKLEKFSDEELYAELNRRHADKQELQYKVLELDGFTAKDVVCMQGCQYDWEETQRGYEDEYGPHYYFYLKVDGKLFDFYYMNCATDKKDGNQDNCNPSKWPKSEDEDSNAALRLVPPGFAESMENCYEYHGKVDVKKHLKKYGITNFRIWNPKLVDEETGRDANYDA